METRKVKICSYNVHSFYDEQGNSGMDRIRQFIRDTKPDILGLQESSNLKKIEKLFPDYTIVRHGGCTLLSKLPMDLVEIEGRKIQPNTRTPRFLSARVRLGSDQLTVTCCHLNHEQEPRRMREVQVMEHQLAEVFGNNEPQIWLGDFNSLTRSDYSETEWDQVAEVRRFGHWEPPRTEVTSYMAGLGFKDCWAEMGRPGPVSTCRFSTHIDYVYCNESALSDWMVTEVVHHPCTASDHSPVVVTLEKMV